MSGDFKLENLRIKPASLPDDEALEPQATIVRQDRKHGFALISATQRIRMVGASAAEWMVFVYLAQLSWRSDKPVKLANDILAKLGVDREAKRRALKGLEQRGQITVRRRPNKSPEITVLK